MAFDPLQDALSRLIKVMSTNTLFSPYIQNVKSVLDSSYKLPQELRRFYQWHTLLPVDSWLYKMLFPLGYIMPLEKAIAIREDFLQTYQHDLARWAHDQLQL